MHAAARVKAVGGDAGSEGLSAEEKRRASAIAGKLSTPLLSRAWQMLLKGGEETAKAPNPRAAAEMVLIRLAYTADLPAPDEVIRLLGGEGSLARSGKPAPADNGGARDAPLNRISPAQPDAAAAAPPAAAAPAALHRPPIDDEDPGFDADYDASFGDVVPDDDAPAPGMLADPRSFDEVIALAGERRDMMLKLHLEDRVSLVKFDYTAGSIDLFLSAGRAAADRQRAAREAQRLDAAQVGRRAVEGGGRAPARRGAARTRGGRARAAQGASGGEGGARSIP